MSTYKSTTWCDNLLTQLVQLQEEDEKSTVCLNGYDGVTVKCHVCLLSAASPVLQAKIECHPNQPIFMKKVSGKTWKNIVSFITNGKLDIPLREKSELQRVAETLEIKELIDALASSNVKNKDSKKRRLPKPKRLETIETIEDVEFTWQDNNGNEESAHEENLNAESSDELTENVSDLRIRFRDDVNPAYKAPPLCLIQYGADDIPHIKEHYYQLFEERKLKRQQLEYIQKQEKEAKKKMLREIAERKKEKAEARKKLEEVKKIERDEEIAEMEARRESDQQYSLRKKKYKYTVDGIQSLDEDSKQNQDSGENLESEKEDAVEGQLETEDENGEDNLAETGQVEDEEVTDDEVDEGYEEEKPVKKERKTKKKNMSTRDDAVYPGDKQFASQSLRYKDEVRTILDSVLEPYVVTKEFEFEDVNLEEYISAAPPDKYWKDQSNKRVKNVNKCKTEEYTFTKGERKGQTWFGCSECKTEELWETKTRARYHLICDDRTQIYRSSPLKVVEKISSPGLKSWEELYRCKSCYKIMTCLDEAVSHLSAHENDIVKCCSYTQHLQMGLLLRCQNCNRLWHNPRVYDSHVSRGGKCRLNVPIEWRPELARFLCQLCGLIFNNEAAAEKHANRKFSCKIVKDKEYECGQCGRKFSSEKKYDRHRNSKVPCYRPEENDEDEEYVTRYFQCQLCEFTAEKVQFLTHHVRAKHYDQVDEALGLLAQDKYQCQICHEVIEMKKGTKKSSYYSEHLWVVHKKKCDRDATYYQCKYCDFRCVNTLQWDMHRSKHLETAEERYMCGVCGKKFVSYQSVRCHEKKVHSETTFFCDYCGKGFKTAAHLRSHLPIHTGKMPYECTICGEKFNVGVAASAHIMQVHGIPKQETRAHRKYTVYEENTVPTQSQSRKKGAKQVKQQEVKSSKKEPQPPPSQRYKCSYCNKVIAKSQVNAHLARHTGKNPWQCGVCKKDFLYRQMIQSHMMNDHNLGRNDWRKSAKYISYECNDYKHVQPLSTEEYLNLKRKREECAESPSAKKACYPEGMTAESELAAELLNQDIGKILENDLDDSQINIEAIPLPSITNQNHQSSVQELAPIPTDENTFITIDPSQIAATIPGDAILTNTLMEDDSQVVGIPGQETLDLSGLDNVQIQYVDESGETVHVLSQTQTVTDLDEDYQYVLQS